MAVISDDKFLRPPKEVATTAFNRADLTGIADKGKWEAMRAVSEMIPTPKIAADDPFQSGIAVEFVAPDGTEYKGKVASKSGSDYLVEVSQGESYIVPIGKLSKVTPESERIKEAMHRHTAPTIELVGKPIIEVQNRCCAQVAYKERRPTDNDLIRWANDHYPDWRLVDAIESKDREIGLIFEILAAEDDRPQGGDQVNRGRPLSSELVEGTGMIAMEEVPKDLSDDLDLRDRIEDGETPGMMAEDQIPGGLADDKDSDDFCPIALEEGMKVEEEHTDDPDIAREIAMDHLTEDPHYYKKLKAIEASNIISFDDVSDSIISYASVVPVKNAQVGEPGDGEDYKDLVRAARWVLARFNDSNPDYYAIPQESEEAGDGDNRIVRLSFLLQEMDEKDQLSHLYISRSGKLIPESDKEPGMKPVRGYVQVDAEGNMPVLMINTPMGPETVQEYGFKFSAEREIDKLADYDACAAAADDVLSEFGGYSADAQAAFEARLVKLAVDDKAKDYWRGYFGQYGKMMTRNVNKKKTPKKTAVDNNAKQDLGTHILSLDQPDFEEKIQEFVQQGYTSGILLDGTDRKIFIISKDQTELENIVGHWVTDAYHGPFYAEDFYIDENKEEDAYLYDLASSSQTDWEEDVYGRIMDDAISMSETIQLDSLVDSNVHRTSSRKVAVDNNAKQYWINYFGAGGNAWYGEAMTRDIPRSIPGDTSSPQESASSKEEPAKKEATSDYEGYIKEDSGKYKVKSKNNPDWSGGTYDTKGKAEKRLQQVEMFKHMSKKACEADGVEPDPAFINRMTIVGVILDDIIRKDAGDIEAIFGKPQFTRRKQPVESGIPLRDVYDIATWSLEIAGKDEKMYNAVYAIVYDFLRKNPTFLQNQLGTDNLDQHGVGYTLTYALATSPKTFNKFKKSVNKYQRRWESGKWKDLQNSTDSWRKEQKGKPKETDEDPIDVGDVANQMSEELEVELEDADLEVVEDTPPATPPESMEAIPPPPPEEALEETVDKKPTQNGNDWLKPETSSTIPSKYKMEYSSMNRRSDAAPGPVTHNAPGKDDKKDYDHKDPRIQPSKARTRFEVTRMYSTTASSDNGYIFMDLAWKPEAFKNMSDQNIQQQIISHVKGMESNKEFHDFGVMGRVRLIDFDRDAGVSRIKVRSSETRGIPTLGYAGDIDEPIPTSGIR